MHILYTPYWLICMCNSLLPQMEQTTICFDKTSSGFMWKRIFRWFILFLFDFFIGRSHLKRFILLIEHCRLFPIISIENKSARGEHLNGCLQSIQYRRMSERDKRGRMHEKRKKESGYDQRNSVENTLDSFSSDRFKCITFHLFESSYTELNLVGQFTVLLSCFRSTNTLYIQRIVYETNQINEQIVPEEWTNKERIFCCLCTLWLGSEVFFFCQVDLLLKHPTYPIHIVIELVFWHSLTC